MSEWRETEIGEFADLINGFAFKSDDFNASKLSDNYLPILKIKNVANGDANFNDVVYHEYSDKLKKYVIKNNDILIALTGNHPIDKTQVVGGISRYKYNVDALLNQRVGKLISKNKAKLDEDFLYYFFKWNKTQYYLGNQSSGSASQANISKTDVLSCPISIPYIIEQQEIAKTLSNLDQKITLLRQQNQDLEELAQTLFKRWFVEFEFPNENGEPYKSSGGKIVESELGEIPEGWKLQALDKIVKVHNGYSYKGSELQDSDTALVTLKNFDRTGGFRLDGFKELVSDNFKERHVVQIGDLIVAHTDLTHDAEVLGNPAIIMKNEKYTQLVISMDLVKVESKTNEINTEFLYFLMRDKRFKYHCKGYANGTTVLHLSKSAISEYLFPFPKSFELTRQYSEYARSVYKKIASNTNEIQTLTQLRDTLLPKLMSGELRVNSK